MSEESEEGIYLVAKVIPWGSLYVQSPLGHEVPLSQPFDGCIGVVYAFDSMAAAVEASEDGDLIMTMYRRDKKGTE